MQLEAAVHLLLRPLLRRAAAAAVAAAEAERPRSIPTPSAFPMMMMMVAQPLVGLSQPCR